MKASACSLSVGLTGPRPFEERFTFLLVKGF